MVNFINAACIIVATAILAVFASVLRRAIDGAEPLWIVLAIVFWVVLIAGGLLLDPARNSSRR